MWCLSPLGVGGDRHLMTVPPPGDGGEPSSLGGGGGGDGHGGGGLSQTPRRLIVDAHEWVNKVPAVCWMVQKPPRERAWVCQWGAKTLSSLTRV